MTKEEVLLYFKDINSAYNNCTMYDSLSRMLDEVYQQGREDTIEEMGNRIEKELSRHFYEFNLMELLEQMKEKKDEG